MNVFNDLQDLTYLRWSHIRSSSGTAGTFLKSESTLAGRKTYYKLSNFDSVMVDKMKRPRCHLLIDGALLYLA